MPPLRKTCSQTAEERRTLNTFRMQRNRHSKTPPKNNKETIIWLADNNLDQCIYNKPTASQVAAICVEGDEPIEYIKRDIVIQSWSQGLQRVSELSRTYDPMQYPFLFPKSDYGWHPEILQNMFQKKVIAGISNASQIGHRIILPSSFIGGLCDIYQHYQDAIALVQVYGRLDIFITIMCNPRWPEIIAELMPTQTPQDRPDLTGKTNYLNLI
ncbi:16635_t:CDS:2 [Dentiscutata erythropus]|uniref:16635_t:CDS:1 n=1 Tax=Dentiscutata erythropus TaxID=1348616 RepID=A0A9N9HD60_9GLOM|nr:16635_t:CDS:2 [Dentiscutata erythropus]